MAQPLTLFDLFGEPDIGRVVARWPQLIQPTTGLIGNWPPPGFETWLAALNNNVLVTDVRTGAADDRVGVEAKLVMTQVSAYPEGFPFVFSSMPDVEFRLQYATPTENQMHLFASVSDRGAELVIERMPVEIRLPAELVQPPPQPDGEIPDSSATVEVGEFRVDRMDDLKIVYRRDGPTSIFVHMRLHATEDGEFDIRTAVPVSFGKCLLFGVLPCLAVHDFQLIPSPTLAPRNTHWLRHDVTPWFSKYTEPLDGCFSIRSVQLDPETEPIEKLKQWRNDRSTPAETTGASAGGTPPALHPEFVLNDLVVPFYSLFVLPIPRHVTVGVRRRIMDPNDTTQVFSFANAPVYLIFSRDPQFGLAVNSVFFESLPSGVGVTFDVAFLLGKGADGETPAAAIGLALEEAYTVALSYQRSIDPVTGLPVVNTSEPFATFDRVLHFEIADIDVDVIALRFGFSFGRCFGDRLDVGDSWEGTFDLFIDMPPTGGTEGVVRLRTLSGERLKVIAERVGWRFGSLSFGGLKLPDGVVVVFANLVGLAVQEVGLTAESDATYLSFSGGLLIVPPSGWEVVFLLRRFRWRLRGNQGAPRWKLEGFYLRIAAGNVLVEAGGYYVEERTPAFFRKEIGVTGRLQFGTGDAGWGFAIDFLYGHLENTSPAEEFDYFFAQVVFNGTLGPIWAIELISIRALFAKNMKPKLRPVDRESRDLRYYRWYKETDPVTMPGDRRLASWEPKHDAWAAGLGCGISIAGLGTILNFTLFALLTRGPDEKGFFIVVEARIGKRPVRPAIAYIAIEVNTETGRWRGLSGLDARAEAFVDNAPAWLNNLAKFTGTIAFGNDPKMFAIGRLNDQRSWSGVRFEVNVLGTLKGDFILCIEIVSGGPKGFGLAVRLVGSFGGGVVKGTFNGGIGFAVAVLTTGSSDFAVVFWIEAGIRVVLFRFLRFGISIAITMHNVGSRPTRGELRAELKFETPWFLPDVTWTWEVTFGQLAPADLATSTSPLLAGGAAEGLTQTTKPLHIEHFDTAFVDDPTGRPPTAHASRTFSVNELRAGGPSEATRLANFASNASIRPVATDATIQVDWAVIVNDRLGLGSGVAARGDQRSGDLTLTYDFTGYAVRRRARYGSDLSWHGADQRVELPPDFSDPNGVRLTGSFGPQTISATWDIDVKEGDEIVAMRLLVNSATPFQYATANAAGDEEVVKQNPEWPCCHRGDKKGSMKVHSLTFTGETPGEDIDSPRLFTESASTFVFLRPAIARPYEIGSAFPPGTVVARVTLPVPGVVARLMFDGDVAYCGIRLAWRSGNGVLSLVAFDADGSVVGSKSVPLTPGKDFNTIVVGGTAPIRRVELQYIATQVAAGATTAASDVKRYGAILEVEGALYVGLRDFLDFSAEQSCDDARADFQSGYEGTGKLFLLPNHEYEIALTTRVTVSHPSATSESADVTEHLYFRTKGLPGLNATARVGEELEPYVRSAYAGGRGRLYREEPAAFALSEDFTIALPLSLRPPGGAPEQTLLVRMQLVVRPDAALTASTPFTTTSEDWIVAHRGSTVTVVETWRAQASMGTMMSSAMRTANPFRERLAVLTQRDEVTCDLADPRQVVGAVLIAPPQGTPDPDDPAKELWPGRTDHTARVVLEGAPFVERTVFVPEDLTALSFSVDGGSGDASAWSVSNSALTTAAGTARRYAIFGEDTWNHLRASVAVTLTGAAAGIAMALPGTAAPSEGLFAYVERTSTGARLVLASRTGGGALVEMAQAALPTTIDLTRPIALTVYGFDDKIRAVVGEQMIEADRGPRREGRLALVATGVAAFGALHVQGLELYTFPFTTSRYRSFHEHVQSWRGELQTILADAMGPGTTSATVSALASSTQADVSSAMQPDAPPEARDALFARWIAGLGLPLRDEVTRLEISRFVVGTQTECLLVESPEPLDFTEEVSVTLERRVTTGQPPIVPPSFDVGGRFLPPFEGFPWPTVPPPTPPETGPVPPAPGPTPPFDVAAELRRGEAELRGGAPGEPRDLGAARVAPRAGAGARRNVVRDVIRHARGLDVTLDAGALPAGASGRRMLFAERVGGEGDGPRIRLYSGRVASAPAGRSASVRAIESDLVTVTNSAESVFMSSLLSGVRPGEIVGVLVTPARVIVVAIPTTTYVPVDVRVVQDGSGRRALIFPTAGGGLATGTYRLSLAMDRARWSTTGSPDDLNRYADSALLTLEL